MEVKNIVIETLPFCNFSFLKGFKPTPQLHKENQLKTGCVHTSISTDWNNCSRPAFLMLLCFHVGSLPIDFFNAFKTLNRKKYHLACKLG